MSLAKTLYEIYFEGCTHYALGYLNDKGQPAYQPVEGVPSLEQIEQHLRGEITLGAYTILPGNTVRWCAWDIDAKKDPKKARELATKLDTFLNGIPHVTECSGGKGYHTKVFFSSETSSEAAHDTVSAIRDYLGFPKSGDPHVEIFPKQKALTEDNPRGNLLKLPLGKHPKTGNRSVFVVPRDGDPSKPNEKGWEEGIPLDPEECFGLKTTVEALAGLIPDTNPLSEMVALMVPYWETGQRHDISLYLAGYLAFSGWTEEAVAQVITLIHEEVPEGDLKDQLKAVKSTFKKYYEGEKITGANGLNEILPGSVMKRLVELAGEQTFSVALKTIDTIRLSKGPVFLKVRSSAKTILSHCKEHGRLVRDVSETYWLNYETSKLVTIDSRIWDRLVHNQFGLNLSESFGRQVAESVRHYAYDDAKEVPVFKRSYWSGTEHMLNLGGPEVYVSNGDPGKRRVFLNGEADILFLNSEDTLLVPNLVKLEGDPISPWQFLTDDVNFQTGDNISATSNQQRNLFKAWIMSILFAQILPTRPILAIMASMGAGKTTTARRVLRLIEGPSQEVLGVVSDKPDAFRASLVAHKVLVLDNFEKTKANWLTDILNRASTGAHIELRELHTTNRIKKQIPDCNVILTTTTMPYSEETLYSRMLPLELAKLTQPRPEYLMQYNFSRNFNHMWLAMLDDIDKTVAQLLQVKTFDAPNESRLADFTVFCNRIKGADYLNADDLMGGLGSLMNRQKEALEKNSPFVDALDSWMRTRSEPTTKWMTISELHSTLQKYALMERKIWRWDSAQGLSKHVGMLESQLIQHYGMSVRDGRDGNRVVRQYRFSKQLMTM